MLFQFRSPVGVALLTYGFLTAVYAQDLPDPGTIAATRAITFPAITFTPPAPPTFVKRVDEVNLLLSVTNHRGRFIENLDPSDLVISDNGAPPDKITYFQRQTDLPLRVALVVDTSDSVRSRFAFEQKSVEAFLKRVVRPETDLALIVGFNRTPTVIQPATRDLSRLGDAIRSLTNGGDTAVFDAVALASDQLMALPDTEPVRRVIVLITDGADNSSHIGLDQAAEHALRAESAIYVVNTNDVVLSSIDKEADRVTRYLADATGGRTLYGATEHDISKSFEQIQQELRSQYAVSYRPHHLISDLVFRSVRILGPKGVRIRYRSGYYAH
jgi:VWFA-related protein